MRPRAVILSLGLAGWLALCGLVTGVRAAEPAASEPAARRWHRHLERFDRELARRWDRTLRERARRGQPQSERGDRRPDRSRDLSELRVRLDLLELRIHALPDEEGRPLRAKVRSLARRLDNLELARKGGAPLPEHRVVSTGEAVTDRPGITSLVAAASNLCTAAPVIGNGTFTGTTVGATNDGTATCGSSSFSPDVWFRYVAPADGPVSMDTFGSGYDTVLSLHTGCPGSGFELRCNDDVFGLQSAISFTAQAGVSYWVRVSGFAGATGPFELHVGSGGAVSGTVTEAGSGTPVTAGEVSVVFPGGFVLQSVPLAADGSYAVGGLTAGLYQVRTDNEQGARDEVWDDHPCTGELLCDFDAGDLVAVESQDTTSGIDFSLDPGGEITGTVRRAANGDPVPDVRIEAWTFPDLELATTAISGAGGTYTLGGLDTGSYLVFAESPELADELYDDVSCPGGFQGFNAGCDAADGTAVAVTLGSTTPGIDFDLVRLGILEGAVTEAATGDPIEGVPVTAFPSVGPTATAFTDATGAFRIAGLPAETYFLKARDFDLLPEVYQEIPCPDFCDVPAVGTPVPLALDQAISGLDFTLEPFGSISGTLTDAVTGVPLDGLTFFAFEIEVFDADGFFEESGGLGSSGTYQVDRVPAGQHFVRTDAFSSPYLDELYDDQPCYEGCEVTGGTAVTVVAGSDTPNVDFGLDRGGTITGTITDSLTGDPTQGRVTVFDLEGSRVAGGFDSGFDGTYSTGKLVPGSYLLEVEPFFVPYVDQLYQGVSCFQGLFVGCRPEQGTPVGVALNTTVPGIDFPLVPMGSISGRVTDAVTGDGVTSGSIRVVDVTGAVFRTEGLGLDGTYTVGELPPRQYLVRTLTGSFFPPPVQYVDEVFDDRPCDGVQCDFDRQLEIGTPVAVTAGTDTPGIDFQLARKRAIAGRVVDASTGSGIFNVLVVVLDGEGGSVASARTGFDGTYLTDPVAPGTYTVFTDSIDGFLDELYDDVPCGDSTCRSTKGTPVQVSPIGDTTGIDFSLEPLSEGLVGTVLDGTTGQPMAGVEVQIWDAGGNPVVRRTTRANGVWFADLPPATYFVSSDAGSAFPDQVYRGVFCDGPCDPLTGTPLVVTTGVVIRGVDFRLRPLSIFTDGFESGDVSGWSRNR